MQVVKPYRELVDLTPEETARVREGSARTRRSAANRRRRDRDAIGERLVLCGGWFAMRRDAFAAIGGFDERFVGWGGEDDAMTIKVERARLVDLRARSRAGVHLWHPRVAATTLGQPDYASNVALLADYARYDETTLARLFEVRPADLRPPRQVRPRRSMTRSRALPNLMIATPAYGGMVHLDFAMSLLDLARTGLAFTLVDDGQREPDHARAQRAAVVVPCAAAITRTCCSSTRTSACPRPASAARRPRARRRRRRRCR